MVRYAVRSICVSTCVEPKEIVDEDEIMVNSVVFDDQSGQLPVVDSLGQMRNTHLLDLLSNELESLGKVPHAGKMIKVHREKTVEEQKHGIVQVDDIQRLK